jgi:hypothetical protein
MTISDNTVVPTPFSSYELIGNGESSFFSYSEGKHNACLFPACKNHEVTGRFVIHMRQGVNAVARTKRTRGPETGLVFHESCCDYHSDISRARQLKKKISLHQRVCFRNVLETVEIDTGARLSKLFTALSNTIRTAI